VGNPPALLLFFQNRIVVHVSLGLGKTTASSLVVELRILALEDEKEVRTPESSGVFSVWLLRGSSAIPLELEA
jgi:hypothetical protein